MWINQSFDFELQRNVVVPYGFTIKHYDTGEPVDLTEYTMRCEIAIADGEPLVTTVNAIEPDKAMGKINFFFDGADFSAVEGDTQIVTLAHNILARDSDNVDYIIARGTITLSPGV